MFIGGVETLYESYPLALNGLAGVLDHDEALNLLFGYMKSAYFGANKDELAPLFDRIWTKYRLTTEDPKLSKADQKAVVTDIEAMARAHYLPGSPGQGLAFQSAAKSMEGEGYFIVPVGRTAAPSYTTAEQSPAFVGPPAPPSITAPAVKQASIITPSVTVEAPKATVEQTKKAAAVGISPSILALMQMHNPSIKSQTAAQIIADMQAGKYNSVLKRSGISKKAVGGSTWIVPAIVIGTVGVAVFLGFALSARYTQGAPKR